MYKIKLIREAQKILRVIFFVYVLLSFLFRYLLGSVSTSICLASCRRSDLQSIGACE